MNRANHKNHLAFTWRRHGSLLVFPALLAFAPVCLSAQSDGLVELREPDVEFSDEREERIRTGLAEIEAYIERRLAAGVAPGAGVSIVYGDEVIYKKAFAQPIQREYSVLSFTKTFTALGILQLYEEGRINLDEPVSTYLGVNLEDGPFRERPITVRHLLTHTSGIPDSGSPTAVALASGTLYVPKQKYAAGEKFQYSNPGYRLLGEVLTRVAGESLQAYLNREVLAPLDMQATHWSAKANGASGMISSVDDLTNYVQFLLARGRYNDRRLIRDETYRLLFTTPTATAQCRYSEYRGIAWRIQTYDQRILLMNHAALGWGVGGFIQAFPEHGIGFVFLSNPRTYNTDAFMGFYKDLRNRLNAFAADVTDMPIAPGSGELPCALDTVPW